MAGVRKDGILEVDDGGGSPSTPVDIVASIPLDVNVISPNPLPVITGLPPNTSDSGTIAAAFQSVSHVVPDGYPFVCIELVGIIFDGTILIAQSFPGTSILQPYYLDASNGKWAKSLLNGPFNNQYFVPVIPGCSVTVLCTAYVADSVLVTISAVPTIPIQYGLTNQELSERLNTLGQKTSANSAPVVLASDQPAIDVNITGPFGQTGVNDSIPVTMAIDQPPIDVSGSTISPAPDVIATGIIDAILEQVTTSITDGYKCALITIQPSVPFVGSLTITYNLGLTNYYFDLDTGKWNVGTIVDVPTTRRLVIPLVSGGISNFLGVVCTAYTSGNITVKISVSVSDAIQNCLTNQELREAPLEVEITSPIATEFGAAGNDGVVVSGKGFPDGNAYIIPIKPISDPYQDAAVDPGVLVRPLNHYRVRSVTFGGLGEALSIPAGPSNGATCFVSMADTSGGFVGEVTAFVSGDVGGGSQVKVTRISDGQLVDVMEAGDCYWVPCAGAATIQLQVTAWSVGTINVRATMSPSANAIVGQVNVNNTTDEPVNVAGDLTALVTDVPQSYIPESSHPLSLTSEGRLRVSSVDSMIDKVWQGYHDNPWNLSAAIPAASKIGSVWE